MVLEAHTTWPEKSVKIIADRFSNTGVSTTVISDPYDISVGDPLWYARELRQDVRAAREEIRRGEYEVFDTVDDFIASLDL